MKIIWEEKDIQVGRSVGKVDQIERWTIGYICHPNTGNQYTLNSNSDGMVITFINIRSLCDRLNKSEDLPVELLK